MKKLFLFGKRAFYRYALLDDADFEFINSYKWYISQTGYAWRTQYQNGKHTRIYLHRLVVGAKQGEEVDHINRNKLDNRKENLRIVSHKENCWNTKVRKDNPVGVTGIRRRGNKWQIRICTDGKRFERSGFNSIDEAKVSYNYYLNSFRGAIL